MKKIVLLAFGVVALSAYSHTATAQEDNISNKKEEELIIRKQGDKDARLTIEMKDDDILINGKPLAEFNDSSLTVSKRKRLTYRGDDVLMGARGGNSFFYNDNDEGKLRPFLGVTTAKEDKGVKVTGVSKGSAAEKAGLKEGDIINKVGDKKIDDPEDLVDAISAYKPKTEVKINYQRNGKAGDIKAILGERKESRMKAFSFNGEAFDKNMMKDFKLQMPPIPKQPFNFWMPKDKRLGVRIEDTDNDTGARISSVEEGSAAEKAGLKKEDIITEVDGDKVKNTDEVREKVLENEKSSYTIRAKRGTTEMSFEIKIPKNLNSADL